MAISGTLAFDPSQLAGLNPGANTSGSTLGPVGSAIAAPAIGGTSSGNPMIPSMPPGGAINPSAMPAYSSPYSATGATAALAGLGGGTGLAGGAGGTNIFGAPQSGAMQGDIARGLQTSGYKGGVGTALAEFLQSGAGFNPQVAQALIAAMQPQFAKGQANLMEQFGSHGLAMGSPAMLGLGDYEAQTNLEVGQLLSGMYEQSVQDYIGVLESGKGQPKAPWWQAASSLISSITGGGVSASQTTQQNAPNVP